MFWFLSLFLVELQRERKLRHIFLYTVPSQFQYKMWYHLLSLSEIKCDASVCVQLSVDGADSVNLHNSSSGNIRNSNENANWNLACVSV